MYPCPSPILLCMNFDDVRDRLDQEFEFPVDHAELIAQVGDIELDGSSGEAETVETVLDRTQMSSYESATDVYELLIGTVTDGYIGRKYYDDRSGSGDSPDGRLVESL